MASYGKIEYLKWKWKWTSAFFEISSCGLDLVHDTFKTGSIAINWELYKVLQAIWNLLNNSPAIRNVYKTLDGTNEFPLHFCKTCCVNVWPNVVQLIKPYRLLSPSQQPQKKQNKKTKKQQQQQQQIKWFSNTTWWK